MESPNLLREQALRQAIDDALAVIDRRDLKCGLKVASLKRILLNARINHSSHRAND